MGRSIVVKLELEPEHAELSCSVWVSVEFALSDAKLKKCSVLHSVAVVERERVNERLEFNEQECRRRLNERRREEVSPTLSSGGEIGLLYACKVENPCLSAEQEVHVYTLSGSIFQTISNGFQQWNGQMNPRNLRIVTFWLTGFPMVWRYKWK